MKKILAVLLAVAMLGSAAAQPQLMNPGLTPSSPFYVFDQAAESFELALASIPVIGGPELKAKIHANHAEERLAEARSLSERNRSRMAEKAVNRYQKQIELAQRQGLQANSTDFNTRFQNVTGKHVDVLEDVRKRVPEQAQGAINRAIENNRKIPEGLKAKPGKGKEVRPSDGKPGQKPGPAVEVQNRTEIVPGNSGKPENPGNEKGGAGGSMEPPASKGPSMEAPEPDAMVSPNDTGNVLK